MIPHRFKRRKARVKYDKSDWESLTPGLAIPAQDPHHAHAIEVWGTRRGWSMRRETQPDGVIMVGRVK